MTDAAFDYRAYRALVPPKLRPPVRQRPQLVRSQPERPPRRGELAQQFGRIRNSLVLIRQSLAEVGAILWRRFLAWMEAHLLQSLTSAWATAGLGWGGFIAFFAAQYFTR